MRILHVIPFFTPEKGGSAQVVYQLAHHLGKRGHQVTVVASNVGHRRAPFPAGPFKAVLLPTIARWGFYFTPTLLGWAARNLDHFDVIHMHEMRTFQNAVIARQAVRRGIPYALSAHGTLPIIVQRHTAKRIYDKLAGQAVLASAGRLVAVSQVEAEQYREAGIEDERIRVVYNGLDLSEYAHLPEHGTFRKTVPGLTPETKIVLYLGRLHQQKGIDRLINAFAQIRFQEKAMLVIVGPDDGELTRLEALVAQLGLRDDVLFTGPRYERDKLAALVDADVLVYPGYSEIFGLVPFEALMCGTPVIVANDSGLGQIMNEAQAGYLVRYGDIPGLADAMQQALTQQAQTEAMVQAGQTFIRNNLQWPTIVEKLEQVYAELISAA